VRWDPAPAAPTLMRTTRSSWSRTPFFHGACTYVCTRTYIRLYTGISPMNRTLDCPNMHTHAGYRRRNHWLYVDDSARLGNSVISLASTSGPTANPRDWFQGETGYVSHSLALDLCYYCYPCGVRERGRGEWKCTEWMCIVCVFLTS